MSVNESIYKTGEENMQLVDQVYIISAICDIFLGIWT